MATFIYPAAIASTETFGTLSADQSITVSGIATAEAMGTPSSPINIQPIAVESTEAFGGPTGVQPVSGQYFLTYVNGVVVNEYVAKKSIRIHKSLRSKAKASFTLTDKLGTMTVPQIWQEVLVLDDTGYRMFGGLIESVDTKHISGTPASEYDVRCIGWSGYTDRRIARRYYTQFLGGFASILMNSLVTDTMQGTGVNYVYTGDPGILMGDMMFNHIPVTEAINRTMDAVNWDWVIDSWKNIYIFDATTGFGSAPISFSDDDGQFRKPILKNTKSFYANKVFVKMDRDPGSMNINTYTGDGSQATFPVDWPLVQRPLVYIDGVAQVVYLLGDPVPPAGFDIYTKIGWTSVHTAGDLPLGVGKQLEVYYPGKLSLTFWAADADEIALRGLTEYVEEVKDIADDVTAQSIADELLSRMKILPVDLELETRTSNRFEPGQLVTVNLTKPPVSGSFLVDAVDSTEVDGKFFWHKLSITNSQLKRTNNWNRFMSKLIEHDRNPKDRIEYSIIFALAVTVEGLTNPGLQTGLKKAIRNAPKDGNAINATLRWNSIDYESAVTTSRIVIDVYKNGESIFPAGTDNKLIYPAGSTGTVLTISFADYPFAIVEGDAFTLEVLEADAAAKDGVLEIRVRG